MSSSERERTRPRPHDAVVPEPHDLQRVPESLARVVRLDGDHLRITRRSVPWTTWGVLLLVATVSFIGASFGIGGLLSGLAFQMWSLVLASLMVTLTLATSTVGSLLLAASTAWFGVTLEVGPSGHRYRLPWARRHPGSTVRLTGELGERLRILIDRHQVLAVTPMATGPWTLESCTWLAARMAASLGAELQNELDMETWTRWATDPSYRARHRFDQRIAKSRRNHGDKYAITPVEPKDLAIDATGMRTWNTVLDADGLHRKGTTLPWSEVRDAELVVWREVFQDANGIQHTNTHASVLVLLDDRTERLRVRYATTEKVAELLWLRDRIREHAGRSSDHGSVADVPESLHVVRDAPSTDA